MGMIETASRLIKKHGREIAILRAGTGVSDGAGNTIPGADVSHTALAVSATYAIELQLIAGGLLGAGDQRVLVSVDGLAITPTTDDKALIDGVEYRIVRVSPFAPAGAVIFWELQVRDD